MIVKSLLVGAWLAGALMSSTATRAWAWGAEGHRIIGRLAVEALPDDLPAFLRSVGVSVAVGELAREPDRWRDAGKVHDSDRDPAHFVDLDDQGRILGGPALSALPPTVEAYDAALRAVGSDSWKAGRLPYAMIDSWQQLVKDFTYWRIDSAASLKVSNPEHRAWFIADMAERRALILRDLGILGHYAGDGSQPLHVTVHYNGWGAGDANPAGYTQARIHGPFEGEYVHAYADPSTIRADMTAYTDCHCPIGAWTSAYLGRTGAQVVPLYELYKSGGFVDGDPRGRAFVNARLAAGASAMRDLTVDAWRASAEGRAGWPAVSVADVEAGAVDPYDSLYGID